jgi:multidrug efflux pump subunit AcrB
MIGSGFNPAAVSVPRWRFTLVAFALLVLLGINSLQNVPRTEDPQFPVPVIVTNVTLPGADPIDMEQLIAKPIEDVLSGLDDVTEIKSTAQDGLASVSVEFAWGVDPEKKYDEVVREVNALRGTLPVGIQRLTVEKIRTTETAIRQIALLSDDLPWRRLEKLADDLRESLDRVPGVRDSFIWGAPRSELRVSVDMGRLAELRLPVTAVADALRAAGADAPIGAVHAGDRRFNVKTQGAFKDLEDVRQVPVFAQDGRVIRVDDVATVQWETEEPVHLTRFNGQRAMLVTVTQRDGEDVIRLRGGLTKALDSFEKTLPGNVRMVRAFDQASNVERRLSRLYKDFAIALGLVLITLLPLGLRAGFVVLLSIPLSLLIGVTCLKWLGFSINQLSIAGFVLSLGLLVDDSIVVTENIARHLREGKSRVEAAIEGTGQIAIAVLGCTATLMLSFVPLLFLPQGSGQFIKSLPYAVLLTVAASLLVSLTIIPFLASLMLKRDEHPDGNALLRRLMQAIHRFYRPALHWSLARPRRTLTLILALCLLAWPVLKSIGTSLFPPAGVPQFLIKIETPTGTALARTDQTLRLVESVLAKTEGVDWYVANLGRGNPQIYYNQRQSQGRANYAEVFVQLDDWNSRESTALIDTLRARFAAVPGAEIKVIIFENGPPIDAQIALRISGPDLAVLKQLAARAQHLTETTPGTRDVSNPIRLDRTDLNLGLDEGRAAALGVPAGTPKRVARLALSGEQAGTFRDPDGDAYPVTVRLPMAARNDLEALRGIYVPTSAGGALPLGLIADPRLQSSPARIERFQRLRQTTITAQTVTGYNVARVTAAVHARLNNELVLPPGYHLSIGGQAEAQTKAFSGMTTAVLVAVFGILAVLLLEFGRFKTVLVVAGIIPLGLFGAIMALWITGNSLSFTAAIGIIALIGIEIKNSILLVDFTEQLRREGVELREAIERAGEVRFLPVLLTSATAIGGLIPLALEDSGLFSPMAIAIIGGLVTSTLLSRIATPVFYLLLARGTFRQWVQGLRPSRQGI